MSPSLLLLLVLSVRGRLLRMARRLRSPRYLIGLVVGVAWMWLWIGRGVMRRGGASVQFGLPPEALQQLAGPLGEAAQLIVCLLVTLAFTAWWLVPWGRRSLDFSEPELNLLLPAPLPRRHLIQYSLLRNQPAILLGTGFMSLIAGGPWSEGGVARWLALWLLFSIWDLHSRARGLWLARLAELPRPAAWRRRLALWSGLLLLWVALLWSATSLVYELLAAPIPGGDGIELLRQLGQTWVPAARAGWLGWLLTPMLWMSRPFFLPADASVAQALVAWLPPIAVLLAHNEWVVRSQVRFEEDALAHARRQSRQRDPAARFWKRSQRSRERQPFRLAPQGYPELAIVWKNLMLATRLPVAWLSGAAVAGAGLVVLSLATGLAPRWAGAVAASIGLALPVFSPLISARGMRYDFRYDLLRLDLIRPWPLPGWRLFLGEIGAPIVLVGVQVLFGVCLAIGVDLLAVAGRLDLFAGARSAAATALGLPPALLTPVAALTLLPVSLVIAALATSVENIATLMFPGWMHLGLRKRQAAAHFGQDLIVFFVLSLAILVGMAPGVILVALVLLVQIGVWQLPVYGWQLPLLGLAAALPVAAVVAALVTIGGALWERLDPSQELLSSSGG